jgi:hypothetical protein
MIPQMRNNRDDEQGGLRVSAMNMVRISLLLGHLLGNQVGLYQMPAQEVFPHAV